MAPLEAKLLHSAAPSHSHCFAMGPSLSRPRAGEGHAITPA